MLLKAVATVCALTLSHAVNAASWDDTLAQARGQTVYWHAWGGDPQINAYIEWVGDQVQKRHASTVHVKLTDTAEAVARVVAEKTAGSTEGGGSDLDQRRELRLDEGAGSAVRPVRSGPAELPLRRHRGQADHAGRLHGADRWPRGASGAWPSSCSSPIPRPSPSRRARCPPCLNGSRTIPDGLPIRRRPTSSAAPF